MYLYLACNVALLLLWVWFPDHAQSVGDTPFSALTLNMVFTGAARFIVKIGSAAGLLILLFKSLAHDAVWPWRWTLKRFGNILFRAVLIFGGFFIMNMYNWQEWTFIAAWFLFVPTVAFVPEFSIFDEPNDRPAECES